VIFHVLDFMFLTALFIVIHIFWDMRMGQLVKSPTFCRSLDHSTQGCSISDHTNIKFVKFHYWAGLF